MMQGGSSELRTGVLLLEGRKGEGEGEGAISCGQSARISQRHMTCSSFSSANKPELVDLHTSTKHECKRIWWFLAPHPSLIVLGCGGDCVKYVIYRYIRLRRSMLLT